MLKAARLLGETDHETDASSSDEETDSGYPEFEHCGSLLDNAEDAESLGLDGTEFNHPQTALSTSTYTDVDKAVFTWFLDTRARNVPISGTILQQKAKGFACILGHEYFKVSNGWLQGFKSQHSVVGRVISGKFASADSDASASSVAEKLPGILDHYEVVDLYNANEKALFYQMLPNRMLALNGDNWRGGKQSTSL
ncbi:hypothetical protein HPB50_009945 [Hyalomma asiaticum]|uniref:Uncharacterized protein n=1 Tax=Hyalomma asiaticum TaxID=266040 RepID=A0ACB7TK92_HYAAI|nr:hypothetical protein HPB50_009945 [Hyalomma asiaticum]